VLYWEMVKIIEHHFATEERLMEQYQYKQYKMPKQHHSKFLKILDQFEINCEEGDLSQYV